MWDSPEIRHGLDEQPKRWLKFGDGRRDDLHILRKELLDLFDCCCDHSGTLPILDIIDDFLSEALGKGESKTREDIVDEYLPIIMRQIAVHIDGVCSDIEDRHARNKTDASKSVKEATLAMSYTLREAVHVRQVYATAPDLCTEEQPQCKSSHASGPRVFHELRSEELSCTTGLPGGAARARAQSQKLWAELSEEEKLDCNV